MAYMCVVLCWNYCSFNQCLGPFCKPYTWWQKLRSISIFCLQKPPVVSNFALIPKSSHPFCVFNVHCAVPSCIVHCAVPSVLIFVLEQRRPGRWWLLALASASQAFLQDKMIVAHCTRNKEGNNITATQPDCSWLNVQVEEITTDCWLQGQPSLMDTTCGRFSPEVLLSCKWNESRGRVI